MLWQGLPPWSDLQGSTSDELIPDTRSGFAAPSHCIHPKLPSTGRNHKIRAEWCPSCQVNPKASWNGSSGPRTALECVRELQMSGSPHRININQAKVQQRPPQKAQKVLNSHFLFPGLAVTLPGDAGHWMWTFPNSCEELPVPAVHLSFLIRFLYLTPRIKAASRLVILGSNPPL